jgi:hypothetical protein
MENFTLYAHLPITFALLKWTILYLQVSDPEIYRTHSSLQTGRSRDHSARIRWLLWRASPFCLVSQKSKNEQFWTRIHFINATSCHVNMRGHADHSSLAMDPLFNWPYIGYRLTNCMEMIEHLIAWQLSNKVGYTATTSYDTRRRTRSILRLEITRR